MNAFIINRPTIKYIYKSSLLEHCFDNYLSLLHRGMTIIHAKPWIKPHSRFLHACYFRSTCPIKSYCSVKRITLKGRPRYKNSAAEKIAYALLRIPTSLTEFTRQPVGITSRTNAYSYLYSENTKLQQR